MLLILKPSKNIEPNATPLLLWKCEGWTNASFVIWKATEICESKIQNTCSFIWKSQAPIAVWQVASWYRGQFEARPRLVFATYTRRNACAGLRQTKKKAAGSV